jgi:hypothetical protein
VPPRFYNGDYYEGRWERGVREGLGMQQCTDDSNYAGEYARGKRHGYGVYSFPNGDQYTGEYEEDLPQVRWVGGGRGRHLGQGAAGLGRAASMGT